MHIHPPKPPHSWSDLLREVGVIVVGILLALGAEQIIERLHWREQTRIADEGMAVELHDSLMFAYERVIIDPCLRGQIRLLNTRLVQRGPHWAATPHAVLGSVIGSELPRAYRAPNRYYRSDLWTNAVSSGIIGHMAPDHVQSLSARYSYVNKLALLLAKETEAASRLAVLANGTTPLSPDARVGLLAALSEVDWSNAVAVRTARGLLAEQARAHLYYDKAAAERDRRYELVISRAALGNCVADLPLDLG